MKEAVRRYLGGLLCGPVMSNNGVGYIDLDLLRRRIWPGSMNYTQLL